MVRQHVAGGNDSRLAAVFSNHRNISLTGAYTLFGAILMLNLRLCRLVMKDLPVRQVASDLSPWLSWSLAIILVSGFMLFSSEAMKCYASVPFQAKMLFLFAAMAYHFTIYRKVTNTDREPKPVWSVALALVSVVLWLGVGLGGRGIGFL